MKTRTSDPVLWAGLAAIEPGIVRTIRLLLDEIDGAELDDELLRGLGTARTCTRSVASLERAVSSACRGDLPRSTLTWSEAVCSQIARKRRGYVLGLETTHM